MPRLPSSAPPPPVIGTLSPRQVESFRSCLDEVARERRFLLLLEAPPLAEVRRFFLVAREAGAVQLAAVAGGEVVGWCDILRARAEGCGHAGTLGMGLRREWRGRGIGRRLLEAAVTEAASRGLTRVELQVFASNANAIALYERCGFEHEGRRRRARHLDGAWDDLVLMARLLD